MVKDINSMVYIMFIQCVLPIIFTINYLLSVHKGISTVKVVPRFISV